jgi:hypothetical protein
MIGTSNYRAVCGVFALCAFAGLFRQEKLMAAVTRQVEYVASNSEAAQSIQQIEEQMDVPSLALDVVTNTAAAIATAAVVATGMSADPARNDTLLSRISFGPEKPLFVLSLANHYDLAIPRYFECAGYHESTLGRLW